MLVPALQELHENDPSYGLYLFGSTLREDAVPSDIDVIVVYRKGVDISTLKAKLNALSIYYPLDITYMTESEERELNPTTSLWCVGQICLRRIAVLWSQETRERAFDTPINSCVRSACSTTVAVGLIFSNSRARLSCQSLAEQRRAADCLQRPLHSRFRQQLTPSVRHLRS